MIYIGVKSKVIINRNSVITVYRWLGLGIVLVHWARREGQIVRYNTSKYLAAPIPSHFQASDVWRSAGLWAGIFNFHCAVAHGQHSWEHPSPRAVCAYINGGDLKGEAPPSLITVPITCRLAQSCCSSRFVRLVRINSSGVSL